MIIKGKTISLKQLICLALYYSIAQFLPKSNTIGNIGGLCRRFLCKRIFKKCGRGVNIERRAFFASGVDIEIGNYSGIGINAHIPNGTKIGDYVMMGPNCFILDINHNFDRTDIPMSLQGSNEKKIVTIEDDVWIGRDVFILPGRIVKKGSIVAARCLLSKDFPEYSIIGGNPSKLIRSRNQNNV